MFVGIWNEFLDIQKELSEVLARKYSSQQFSVGGRSGPRWSICVRHPVSQSIEIFRTWLFFPFSKLFKLNSNFLCVKKILGAREWYLIFKHSMLRVKESITPGEENSPSSIQLTARCVCVSGWCCWGRRGMWCERRVGAADRGIASDGAHGLQAHGGPFFHPAHEVRGLSVLYDAVVCSLLGWIYVLCSGRTAAVDRGVVGLRS